MPLTRLDFHRAAFIAGLLLISYSYFFSSGGWNESSRLDLAKAIVDQRTFAIDDYHRDTGDKAFHNGHYYSDKAPGTSFAAVPIYAMARLLNRSPRPAYHNARHAANILTVAVPTALAGAGIYLWALAAGFPVAAGIFAAIVFGLGTPIWGYATVLWGHAPCGALLLFAAIATWALQDPQRSRRSFQLGLAVGLCCGWATVTEYPAAVPSAFIALIALYVATLGGSARLLRVAAGIAAGAVPCALLLGWYHTVCFGSPLATGYQYEVLFADAMNTGYSGLTHPNLDVISRLLFFPHRGLLPMSPVLLAAFVGLVLLLRRKTAVIAAIALFVFIFYLLLNSSFIAWEAGGSIGPRYLGPTLPLLCLGLVAVWARAGRALRIVLLILSSWGFMTAAISAIGFAQSLGDITFPVLTIAVAIARGLQPPAPNIGTHLGLHGFASIIPLLVLWAAWLLLWRRHEQQTTRRDAAHAGA